MVPTYKNPIWGTALFLPSGYDKIAIEHGHLYWIYMDLPIKNSDFP